MSGKQAVFTFNSGVFIIALLFITLFFGCNYQSKHPEENIESWSSDSIIYPDSVRWSSVINEERINRFGNVDIALYSDTVWREKITNLVGCRWLMTMFRGKSNTPVFLQEQQSDTLIFRFERDNRLFINDEYAGTWVDYSYRANQKISCVMKLDFFKPIALSDSVSIPDGYYMYGFYGNGKRLHLFDRDNRVVFSRFIPE